MGVAGLYSYIIKRFGKSLSQTDLNINKIDWLFIDGNGFIHNASSIINKIENLEYKTANDFYMLICKKTKELIDEVINKIKPKNVYLAFDGIAPLAKINQQRSRRYRTLIENEFIEKCKEKYGMKSNYSNIWSSVLITPGTDFMNTLNEYFKSLQKEKLNYNFYYDGSDIIGEGEHKILNYIRNNNEISNQNIILHGLDGDLIFLTMLIKNNNIYIYRQQKSENDIIDNFLNITELKNKILDYVWKIISLSNKNFVKSDNIIIDFIFICFLVGNDFLPSQRFINIHEKGIDELLDCYIQCLKTNGFIIKINENNKISFDSIVFLKFIQLCSLIEFKNYKISKQTANINLNKKIRLFTLRYDNMNEGLDKDIYGFENLLCKTNDKRDYYYNFLSYNNNFDNYKFEYYTYFLHSINNQKTTVDKVCDDYIKTLIWNIKYYLSEDYNWRWFYKYPICPFLSDLLKYLNTNNIILNNYTFLKDDSLNNKQQLLLCIPKKYLKSYLPNIYNLINFENGFMFPEKFYIDTTDQLFIYKSIVKIPIIDMVLINDVK
jgi:5'-3' exonuclease